MRMTYIQLSVIFLPILQKDCLLMPSPPLMYVSYFIRSVTLMCMLKSNYYFAIFSIEIVGTNVVSELLQSNFTGSTT